MYESPMEGGVLPQRIALSPCHQRPVLPIPMTSAKRMPKRIRSQFHRNSSSIAALAVVTRLRGNRDRL